MQATLGTPLAFPGLVPGSLPLHSPLFYRFFKTGSWVLLLTPHCFGTVLQGHSWPYPSFLQVLWTTHSTIYNRVCPEKKQLEVTLFTLSQSVPASIL